MNVWIEGYPVSITQLSENDLKDLQTHYLPKCLDLNITDKCSDGGASFAKNESQRWSKDKKLFIKWNDTITPYIKSYIDALAFQFPWEMRIDTWFNVHGKYDFQHIHNHVTTDCPAFSCVVILKQPNEDAGQFCFHSPNFSTHLKYLELDPLNAYPNAFMPEMRDGAMIIFPSCLEHYVTQNLTDEYRVVFASNIMVKRTNSLF